MAQLKTVGLEPHVYLCPLGYGDGGLPPLEFPTLFPDKCNESVFARPVRTTSHFDKTSLSKCVAMLCERELCVRELCVRELCVKELCVKKLRVKDVACGRDVSACVLKR